MKRALILLLVCIAVAGVVACDKAESPIAPTITYTPPLILQFAAAPMRIAAGSGTTLVFDVAGSGVSCRIDPLIGDIPCSGSKTVAPTTTTEFTLTAANPAHTRVQKTTVVVQ